MTESATHSTITMAVARRQTADENAEAEQMRIGFDRSASTYMSLSAARERKDDEAGQRDRNQNRLMAIR